MARRITERRRPAMGETAIEFRDVSRRFILRHERRTSFQDWFIGLVRSRGKAEEFWALRNVSFSVRRGEAVGILGHNGAGKSTLLKLVTRILEPTSGEIVIRGQTHAMLELGAGFHPELSGHDNIFLNGSIYGFNRRQVAERFDDIVQFAELERFIDTPVKHYSSGMFMRLGFAIAVHMDPDILVIDEVLAVGDAAFQRKSYERLHELRKAGTTILFVSHNAEQVRHFCDRAVLLQQGALIDAGPADAVVDHYTRLLREQEVQAGILRTRLVDRWGMPVDAIVSGDDLGIDVLLRLTEGASPQGLLLALDLYDQDGTHLFGSTGELPEDLPALDPGEPTTRRARVTVGTLPVAEGTVTAAVTLQRANGDSPETLDRQETTVGVLPRTAGAARGLLHLPHRWGWEGEEGALDGAAHDGAGAKLRRS